MSPQHRKATASRRRRFGSTALAGLAALVTVSVLAVAMSKPSGAPTLTSSTSPKSGAAPTAVGEGIGKAAETATPVTIQRAIILDKAMIEQVVNGAVVATHPLPAEQPYSLAEIAAVVNDSTWLTSTAPGVYLLEAALIASPGTVLGVDAPTVTTLRLATGEGVFIGGEAALGAFSGVTITSWDVATGTPDVTAAAGRPFLLFQNNSTLSFTNTTVSDLGSTQVGASGVTLKSDPTPGSSTGSTFSGNEDGLQLLNSGHMTITKSQFNGNVADGVRIADHSKGAQISSSAANSNGTTGFDVEQDAGTFSLTGDSASHDVTGILLQHTRGTATVSGSHLTDNTSAGVALRDASMVSLASTQTTSNRIGVEISESTYKARVKGLTSNHDRVGLEVHNSYVPELSTITIRRAQKIGIIADSQRLVMQHANVSATPVGVEVRNTTTIRHSTVTNGLRGLAIWPNQTITLTDTTVKAKHIGVELGAGASAYVLRSAISAPEATRGGHTRSLSSNISGAKVPILLLLPGAGLLLLCVILEMLMTFRQRRDPGPAVPRHVWNVT